MFNESGTNRAKIGWVADSLVCEAPASWVDALFLMFFRWSFFEVWDQFWSLLGSFFDPHFVIFRTFYLSTPFCENCAPVLAGAQKTVNLGYQNGTQIEQRLALIFVLFWDRAFSRFSAVLLKKVTSECTQKCLGEGGVDTWSRTAPSRAKVVQVVP